MKKPFYEVNDLDFGGVFLPRVSTRRWVCSNSGGKFMVRVPPAMHRELTVEAAEAGVSLNRLATVKK